MRVQRAYSILESLNDVSSEIENVEAKTTAKNNIYELRSIIVEIHDGFLNADNKLSVLNEQIHKLKTQNDMLQAALNGIIEGLERECD